MTVLQTYFVTRHTTNVSRHATLARDKDLPP
jgi:hypothetical protein